MAETTTGVRAVLSAPQVFELWSRMVGADSIRRTLIAEYLRPRPNDRLLDLGCGPGDLLPYLDDVRYVGIDHSAAYIKSARERFGDLGEFLVGDATTSTELRDFDLAICFGVLHHIDDEGCRALFAAVTRALRPDGRALMVDPVLAPDQSRIARAIIRRDRGQHVRSAEEYEALAATSFGDVRVTVRHDLLRMPYSHCILECMSPAAS